MMNFAGVLAVGLLAACVSAQAIEPGFMLVDFWSPPDVLPLPDDLSPIPTPELLRTEQQYQTMLKGIHSKAAEIPDADQRYLVAQHQYDLVRLKIADVLPNVIQRYSLDSHLKDLLGRYSNNFADFRAHMRQPKEPEYKFYDMHLSMTFVTMRIMLAQSPEVDARFTKEMHTPGTPLGNYGQELDSASAELDQVKAVVKAQTLEKDLMQRVKRIDAELAGKRRQYSI
jgi:hypothetical protein